MSQLMIKEQVPKQDYLTPGHLACPGCGAPIAMRLVLKALGPKTIVTLPACCWSIIAGPFPQSSVGVPLYHTAFETGASLASGIRAALDIQGDDDTTVVVWAGDGGTFDIGIQALSGAAERNENFLYCCYDNEAYMNTGVQRSSSTPWGAWTTTTPADSSRDACDWAPASWLTAEREKPQPTTKQPNAEDSTLAPPSATKSRSRSTTYSCLAAYRRTLLRCSSSTSSATITPPDT